MDIQENSKNENKIQENIENNKNNEDGLKKEISLMTNQFELISQLTDDEYRKIGFYSAIDLNKGNCNENLINSINKIKTENEEYFIKLDEVSKKYIENFETRIKYFQIRYNEKIVLKNEYEEELRNLKLQRKNIQSEISDLRNKILEILTDISSSKDGIISKRFGEIDVEINRLIEIHERIEDKQNPKYKQEYDDYKKIDDKKIEFYENLRRDFQVTYDDVKKRIKLLNNAGINNFSSAILIILVL